MRLAKNVVVQLIELRLDSFAERGWQVVESAEVRGPLNMVLVVAAVAVVVVVAAVDAAVDEHDTWLTQRFQDFVEV
jgi:hypothetical protein